MTTPFEIFRTPIQIRRFAGGVYVNGIWQELPPTIINATASVQPLTGIEVMLVPESRRDKENYAFFTSTQILGITTQNPDQVTVIKTPFAGLIFETLRIDDWQNNPNFTLVNHYKYIAMRLNPLP